MLGNENTSGDRHYTQKMFNQSTPHGNVSTPVKSVNENQTKKDFVFLFQYKAFITLSYAIKDSNVITAQH